MKNVKCEKTKKLAGCLRLVCLLGVLLLASGCGSGETAGDDTGTAVKASAEVSAVENQDGTVREGAASAPVIEGLTCTASMPLSYAECFNVYYYEGGYALIDVHDGAKYLVIPEGSEAPEGLSSDIIVLKQPLEHIYLAATSAMALFDSLDALDRIRMTGTDASGWYIDHAVTALNNGNMVFAGRYNAPDYELLVNEGCDLAIESTMLLHVPKVQEMIEALDIPVFIDRSSYESHPLGRTEWIKVYGVLTGKETEAEAFFETQAEVMRALKNFQNTEKTVAFFYVKTDGSVVVRKTEDYIPKMIEIAGGRYIFDDLTGNENNQSAVNMTMEEFYNTAMDADYLIYNAAIDNPVQSIDELLAKSELFADFKAVQENNVWTTGKSLYQATDIVGNLITDIHLMLTDGDEAQMTFLTRVK